MASIARFLVRAFADWLNADADSEKIVALRAVEGIGRPLDSTAFLDGFATATGRNRCPRDRGPKPDKAENAE